MQKRILFQFFMIFITNCYITTKPFLNVYKRIINESKYLYSDWGFGGVVTLRSEK
jgi:hypothetical protein